MMVNIFLHGALAKKVGRKPAVDPIRMDVDNSRIMFKGLGSQVKGFNAALRSLKYGVKVVCLDKDKKQAFGVTPDTLMMGFPANTESVHILPGVKGSGVEVGAAVAAALGVAAGTAAYYAIVILTNIALGLVMGAVAQALAPSPDTSGGSERPDERSSFIFNGAVNTVEQGGVIPLVYGECMTGSVVISAGINVEETTA